MFPAAVAAAFLLVVLAVRDRPGLRALDLPRSSTYHLLAVLVEMTGDHRWMADRYRPTRSRGMDDNSSGGLGEDVQQEIRAAVVDALEDKGYVSREPDPHDRRASVVVVTDAGRAVRAAVHEARRRSVGDQIGALSAEQRAALADALTTLEQGLD